MITSLSRKVLAIVVFSCISVAAWAAPERGISLRANLGYAGFGPVEQTAPRFAAQIAPRFRGTGAERFRTVRVQREADGSAHVRLQQEHRGLPVVGADVIVHLTEQSGAVTGIDGRFVAAERLPAAAAVSAGVAIHGAVAGSGITAFDLVDTPALTYIVTEDGDAHLAWSAHVAYVDDEGHQLDRVFADAIDGSLVARHPQVWRAKYRKIYSANYGTTLPGSLLFVEGGSSSDVDAQKAYEHSGNTYDYYSARHGRDSWNNAGGDIVSSVHYGAGTNNAFWSNNQMAFGDGDGVQFIGWARGLDLVGHEFTHGVTQATANLTYANESGALNESMSDIFGNAVEAYTRGASANNWKVFEDIKTPGTAGDAERYMNHPTLDGSSKDYYPERYTGSADNGGVHWNSGIGNLAFYLLSQGGTHPRSKTSVSVSGIGMTTAENIFYRALTTYMYSSTNFSGARDATLAAAADLHGPCSSQYAAVNKAWDAVGVPRNSGREYEPNDSMYTQYNQLQPYSGYASGYICSTGDADWYQIQKLYSYSNLSVSLSPPANADFDVELWQSGKIGQSTNTGNGTSEYVSWSYGTGMFYIKVFGKNGATSTSPYSLSVSQ